ncbi:MAG: hypothetical protein JNM43_25050 [Planctomycetaceae bacterium]|nr:hypothetical protein [Planctomycetaceae bacterium]
MDNHQVSEETVQQVGDYLASRGLSDVRIRVNQYDPSGEWRRLRSNSEISPGWKYTVGLLKFAEYSLLPGRLFGGDEYNPFTNSLSLYSDSAALGLVESAYALDIHHRELPGTYAASQELPWIGLWHEVLATQEAMDYATHVGTSDPLYRDRHTLYARYGMIMGDALFGFGPANGISVGGVAGIAGAVGGHAAAAIQNQINRT